jgi:hypothetical protein
MDDPYDTTERPEQPAEDSEMADDVAADGPAHDAADGELALHPIDAPVAQETEQWRSAVLPEPPMMTRPVRRRPARNRTPLLLALAVLAALAVGAAVGLAFPQVRGVSQAQYDRLEDRAGAQKQAREEADAQVDQLESQVSNLETENGQLKDEKSKLEAATTAGKAEADKLRKSEQTLAATMLKLRESTGKLQTTTEPMGDVVEVSRLNGQVAVTMASLSNEITRLYTLTPARKIEGDKLIDTAANEIEKLVAAVDGELAACAPKDKPCKSAAALKYIEQMKAIDAKLDKDITTLVSKPEPAATATGDGAQKDSGDGATDTSGTTTDGDPADSATQ